MVCDRSQKEKTERQLCGDTGNKVHVVKFISYKKATKIDKIFTIDLTLSTYIASNRR